MLITFLAQVQPINMPPVEESVGIFQMMQRGGVLMVVLFLCSIAAMGVFTERLFYYKRCRMNVNEFLAGILALVRRQSFREAIERCDEGHGPIVNVVSTAILKRHLPPAELREVVKEIAQLEIPNLEANVSILGTIGYVAPLLGLLGTVTGMIEAFEQINRTSGTASVAELSQGIYTALITSAAGLAIAIPCYLAHNFLVAQVHSLIADMERAGIETIHTLTDLPRKDMIAFTPATESKDEKSDKPTQAKKA